MARKGLLPYGAAFTVESRDHHGALLARGSISLLTKDINGAGRLFMKNGLLMAFRQKETKDSFNAVVKPKSELNYILLKNLRDPNAFPPKCISHTNRKSNESADLLATGRTKSCWNLFIQLQVTHHIPIEDCTSPSMFLSKNNNSKI